MHSILIIEDEADILELLSHHLTREGYDVTAVNSLAYAQAQLEIATYDLMLTDMYLCDGDAIELIRHTKEAGQRAKMSIVLMTGGEFRARKSQDVGIDAVLRKPFALGDVRRVLTDLLQ